MGLDIYVRYGPVEIDEDGYKNYTDGEKGGLYYDERQESNILDLVAAHMRGTCASRGVVCAGLTR